MLWRNDVLIQGDGLAFSQPEGGVSGKYIIAHELAHAHENYFRDRQLPGILLQHRLFGAQEILLFQTADTCWSEYAASNLSAAAYPEHGLLYERTFVAALRQFAERILVTKREWAKDQDYGKAWARIPSDVTAVLRYASYLMGHVSGLNEVFENYASEAWILMKENAWLLPRFDTASSRPK